MRGATECIDLLVQKGADMNAKDYKGCTILHEAAGSGCIDTVAYLLSKGIEINTKDSKGATPLQYLITELISSNVKYNVVQRPVWNQIQDQLIQYFLLFRRLKG